MRDPSTDQPLPVFQPAQPGMHDVAISQLSGWGVDEKVRRAVQRGLEDRRALGLKKYHVLLQANNGRDALLDAWQEAIDLLVYTYQVVAEDPGAQVPVSKVLSILEDIARLRLARGDVELQ